MLCTYCHTPNPEGSQFCMACGRKLEPPDNATKKLPETGSETVRLPESELSGMHTPPPAHTPPTAPPVQPPAYTPPASSPPTYTPPVIPPPPPSSYTPPAYTPPGYTPPEASTTAVSRLRSLWESRRARLALIGGALFLLLLLSALLVTRLFPSLLPKGQEILLALPQSPGEYDLIMLKPGQEPDRGVLLAENAQSVTGRNVIASYLVSQPAYRAINLSTSGFGGFVPESNRLLYYYVKRDRVYVEEIRTSDKEPVEIMRTDALPLSIRLFTGKKEIFLQETRDGLGRCYMANPRQPAERIARGNMCSAVWNGTYSWIEDRDGNELSLSLLPLSGNGDPIPVFTNEREIGNYVVARDGNYVAYTQSGRRGWQLSLFTTKGSKSSEVGAPAINIPQLGFLGLSGTLFYIAQNDEGLMELFLSSTSTPIAEGFGLAASVSDDGRYLVYMTMDRDGESTVASYDVRAGKNQNILTGDNLQYGLISAHNTLLITIRDLDIVSIYRANMDGSGLELLFEEEGVNTGPFISYLADQDRLFIWFQDNSNYDSLFTSSISKADGFYLMEEWYDIQLLNRAANGRTVVLAAQEDRGDDYILFSVALQKGNAPVKLDDRYESYRNAVFLSNNRDILYTGIGGSRYDDTDVLRVSANGGKPGEVLYQEAELLDARWDRLNPFQFPAYTNLHTARR